jgi:hypothetical protein
LADLVTYNNKNNLANGEENNDGENHNYSWNCGEEGDFASISVKRLRKRQMRNFFVSLMVSQVKLTICCFFNFNSCSKLVSLMLCTLNYDTGVEGMSSKYKLISHKRI